MGLGGLNLVYKRDYNGVGNPFYGKKHTPEAIEKIRQGKLGSKNPKWVENMTNPRSGRTRAEKMFPCPKGLERHHINGDSTDNRPENIEFLTRKEHMIKDGRMAVFKKTSFKKGAA